MIDNVVDFALPIIATSVAVLGFVITNIRNNKTSRNIQKASDIERAMQQEKILNCISNLTSKEYLDQRLKEELAEVEKGVKDQISSLKTDMKEEMREIKMDIKTQQEITQSMSKDVVRAVESANHANERVISVDKRVDDLRELFLASQKKP